MIIGNDVINYVVNIIFGFSVGCLLFFIVILFVLGVVNGFLFGMMCLF